MRGNSIKDRIKEFSSSQKERKTNLPSLIIVKNQSFCYTLSIKSKEH
ncbi:MAG: Unknown protein [uncultured Sulfurovum sp.]|uniref:Uncharacterized protein n=1 Tax=uncultured Sulfurovum sp. TaxID=269237 RepID=A0A6S6U5Y1_9BACT|nr:MAG: Unknown protein [uncultured Sulfurovum sp.]